MSVSFHSKRPEETPFMLSRSRAATSNHIVGFPIWFPFAPRSTGLKYHLYGGKSAHRRCQLPVGVSVLGFRRLGGLVGTGGLGGRGRINDAPPLSLPHRLDHDP